MPFLHTHLTIGSTSATCGETCWPFGKPRITTRPWYLRNQTLPVREAYRNAAESAESNPRIKSLAHGAHGRLLAGLGRDKEAFGHFLESIKLDADNIDSKLGRVEMLTALAGTAPHLNTILLTEAWDRLDELERHHAHSGVNMDEIKEKLSARFTRTNFEKPEYPTNSIDVVDESQLQMVAQAYKYGLYMTPCAACRQCDHSLGDVENLGVNHAVFSRDGNDLYRRIVVLVGRLGERQLALRSLLINYMQNVEKHITEQLHSHLPELSEWKSAKPAATALIAALAGSHVMLEGMAAAVALLLRLDVPSPTAVERVLGTPQIPHDALRSSNNPALHGFWDLWADGMEGIYPGVPKVLKLWQSLHSEESETFSRNDEALTEAARDFVLWQGMLIAQLIRIVDREANGELEPPPLWPLQAFELPTPPSRQRHS